MKTTSINYKKKIMILRSLNISSRPCRARLCLKRRSLAKAAFRAGVLSGAASFFTVCLGFDALGCTLALLSILLLWWADTLRNIHHQEGK